MFAFEDSRENRPGAVGRRDRPPLPGALAVRARPVAPASSRVLPVHPALSGFFPDGALRRGSTTVVAGGSGSGATSLSLAVLAGVTRGGGWGAVVGLADPGVVAVGELGVDLQRVVFVPRPGPGWADAVATLLDGVDAVLVRPPGKVGATVARHLGARARERRGALVILGPEGVWPEGADVVLRASGSRWHGAGGGYGRLRARRVEVRAEARRRPGVVGEAPLWLPSETGALAAG